MVAQAEKAEFVNVAYLRSPDVIEAVARLLGPAEWVREDGASLQARDSYRENARAIIEVVIGRSAVAFPMERSREP